MGYVKLLASIALVLLPFTSLIAAGEDVWNNQKASANLAGDLLNRLNLETASQRTPAPNFSLKDPHGNSLRLRDLKGRVVLLNFWATWCPSCNREFPSMETLHRKFRDRGLVVLAINFREQPQDAYAFVQKNSLSFRVVLDPEGEAFSRYQTWFLPTSHLIDRQGNLLGKAIGYREWDNVTSLAAFQDLLNGER